METIDDTLCKRSTFDILLRDILFPVKPEFKEAIGSARIYWNTLTLERQRLIYYTLREQKRRGEAIKENPRFAIEDCHPVPVNWNGRSGINDMIKTVKMVSARYPSNGRYGIYTAQEAELFGMTEVKPLN